MRKLIAGLLLLPGFCLAQDVITYHTCELHSGSTIADVTAAFEEWKALAEKSRIDYRVRILAPHTGDVTPARFWLEGTAPSLTAYAKAWDWWYTDSEAVALLGRFMEGWTCSEADVARVVSTH